jgi:RNA polymerase sigma-70 factor (ECF subfamily)
MTEKQVNQAWAEHRSYLVDLAFRMLGDIGDAEDMVQEAFSRLAREPVDEIDDPRGWLIVVTGRLCLDQIRSARWRRERTHDFGPSDVSVHRPEPGAIDPADRITLDDSVRLALLVVLERFSPSERVVFVLHDIFGMPFDTISETVGRTPAACRQIARRARQKVEEGEGSHRFEVTNSESRVVTEKFIAACAGGDLEGLLAVLDPDVSGDADQYPQRVAVGAKSVAKNILFYWGGRATLVSQSVGDHAAVLAFIDRRLEGVLELTVHHDRITKIHLMMDPGKLDFLRSQLPTG